MAAGNVIQFTVANTVANNEAFDATIYIITGAGVLYGLSPHVVAGATVKFDLSKVAGLTNGDTIQGRVVSSHGAGHTDETLLTYTSNSKTQALYAVTGVANAPNITFQSLNAIS